MKDLNRSVKTLNIVFTAISWALLVAGLVYVAAIWKEIPDEVGRHFAGNGEFDLYGSKTIAFYHPVVAEYVETEEEREALHEIGCNCYQGYLYSPAVFLDETKE